MSMRTRATVGLTVAACLIVVVAAIMFTVMRRGRGRHERLVKAYSSGALTETDGLIKLPPSLSRMTQDGRIYVTHAPWGSALLFVTWRGKGSNLRGYVYSEDLGPLSVGQAAPFAIELVGPVILSVSGKSHDTIEVQLERMGGDNWYEANRSLD